MLSADIRLLMCQGHFLQSCFVCLKMVVSCIFCALEVVGLFLHRSVVCKLLTIYTSGDLRDVNNYRPIALVIVVSTFFENILLELIPEYH